MGKLNTTLSPAKRVDNIAVVIGALIAYLSLTVPLIPTSGFDLDTLGTRGILTSIIVGFTVPNIYKLCFKYNITIRLPKQVPQAISNAFLSIFPLFFSLMIFGTIG
jgi:PTS system lactose-specific IIC component